MNNTPEQLVADLARQQHQIALLEAEVKTLHNVLGTLISWSYREFGEHGVQQLHKELGRCLIHVDATQ